MFLGDDGARVVRALEEVPTRVMSPVEPHRVDALEAVHAAIERLGFGPNDEVEMVAEEAPGEELPAEARNDIIEEVQEQVAVGGVEEDAAARVPGHRDEVNVALGPEASGVRHRAIDRSAARRYA